MKLAFIKIPKELIADVFKNGERHYNIKNGLPKDAKFVGKHFDYRDNTLVLEFECEDFGDAAVKNDKGALIITPTFEGIYEDK